MSERFASSSRRLSTRMGWSPMLVCVLAAVAGGVHGVSLAQEGAPAAAASAEGKRPDNATLLGDFMHYVRIAKYDLANAFGQELLSKGLKNPELVELVEAGDVARFEETVQRALRVPEVESTAAALVKNYEQGKLERARNPDQIKKNIDALTGTVRGRVLARQRLVSAGEYAMPQLLDALLDTTNPGRAAEVQRVMVDLGRQAIMPLSAALTAMPASQQEKVANVLGLIPYKASLPFLADVAKSSESEAVKAAAVRAIDRLGGTGAVQDPAMLYRQLAEGFYAEKNEVTSFAGEEFQLLWSYNPSVGLVPTAIRTPVFHEAMAMRLAERALKLEEKSQGVNPETVALWVSSNLSREIDTPEGYTNPAYSVEGAVSEGLPMRRKAEYYSIAGGADIAQRVLSRAMQNRDTQLARRALASVEKTVGSGNTSQWDVAARQSLVDALGYPNRRVQFDAALALAAMNPAQGFSSSERVVPTLAAAATGANERVAAVVAADVEQYQAARASLEKLGYRVLAQARNLDGLAEPMSEVSAVDVLVAVGVSADRVPDMIDSVRGTSKLSATPVVVATDADAYGALSRRYENASFGVQVRPVGLSGDQLEKTVEGLVMAYSGGAISDAEADGYSRRALSALRDIAVSNSGVYKVTDATAPLANALKGAKDIRKIQIADVLSRTNSERAQRSLMDVALESTDAERSALLNMVANSAKRFGNQLEERHVARVVEMAGSASDDEAMSAASLLGALNLSNRSIVPLILDEKSK